MQVRRVGVDQCRVRAGGVVQALDERGVGRGRPAAERVAGPQRREPHVRQPLLVAAGVGHGEAVPGHPVVVVQHPGHGVGEGQVGPGPHVPEQVGVVVQGARVVPARPGEQAHPVDAGQVVHGAGPHRRHRSTLAAGGPAPESR